MSGPAYEYADDPRANRKERAKYLESRAAIAALHRAMGAEDRGQPMHEPTRETYEAHRAAVAHFAGIARRAPVGWQPSPLLMRAMAKRGVSLAEVLEEV